MSSSPDPTGAVERGVAKSRVEASTVLASAGTTTVQASFVQRAGLWLAAGVGTLIALATVADLVFLYAHYPTPPPLTGLSAADTRALLDQHKELVALAVKSTQDIFQTVVGQALLPVFTAILGYIFAKGGRD